MLTGLVFGLTFWLVSERRRHSIAERDPRQELLPTPARSSSSWKVALQLNQRPRKTLGF